MTALLGHHGDEDLEPGLVDLAVNVRPGTPPAWLRDRLAAVDLARYPNGAAAVAAVAQRHGVGAESVVITAGAAEAFVLIARAVPAVRPVVVHPQFTEPELALRAAGRGVDRVILPPPFVLDPEAVRDDADLVVVGNPTNPTSVLHPKDTLRALARPGRVLVVDEAFADCVPGEPDTMVGESGALVVRSLTKTWGLAGLRVGYAVGPPALIDRLRRAQPHWPVSAAALEACVACSTAAALAEARSAAEGLAARRRFLVERLESIPGVHVAGPPAASFVLVQVPWAEIWKPLRGKGFAVRRADTFPGLGPTWIRVAVRDESTSAAFAAALEECA